jgi:hypothetical protein
MSHRTLFISAVLAAGASLAGLAQADIVAVDSGIAVKESDGIAPGRGMTMTQVSAKFGAPVTKVPAVGKPPISRWEYPGFVVYFEHDYVIHSVISEAAAPPPESSPQAAPAEARATSQSRPVTEEAPPPPPPPAATAAPATDPNATQAAPPAAAEPVEPPPAP